jgi:hypothetical protein
MEPLMEMAPAPLTKTGKEGVAVLEGVETEVGGAYVIVAELLIVEVTTGTLGVVLQATVIVDAAQVLHPAGVGITHSV